MVRQCDRGTGVDDGWFVVVDKHSGLVDLDLIGGVLCASYATLVAFVGVCGKQFWWKVGGMGWSDLGVCQRIVAKNGVSLTGS